MNIYLFSAILLTTAVVGNANPVQLNSHGSGLDSVCPSGYSQPANSGWKKCYKVLTDSESRNDAVTSCKSSGGTITSVPDAFTNTYLSTLASQQGVNVIWIGVQCFNGNTNTCINDDGSKFSYSNFASGEPQSSNQCIYMATSGHNNQQWYTYDCNHKYQYACEANVNTAKCLSNYHLYQGKCYSFIWNVNYLSGNSANSKCKQVSGGMLATIPNAQVNSFIKSIKPDSPVESTAFGLVCPNIKKDGDRSSCQWYDGTAYSYNAFFYANSPTAEHSGCCDFYDGNWRDCWDCGSGHFDSYVCQANTV